MYGGDTVIHTPITQRRRKQRQTPDATQMTVPGIAYDDVRASPGVSENRTTLTCSCSCVRSPVSIFTGPPIINTTVEFLLAARAVHSRRRAENVSTERFFNESRVHGDVGEPIVQRIMCNFFSAKQMVPNVYSRRIIIIIVSIQRLSNILLNKFFFVFYQFMYVKRPLADKNRTAVNVHDIAFVCE